MKDYMIRGIAAQGEVRFFAAFTKETVETARADHGLSPVATAALGRLLTAGAMMGAMMKSEEDLLTLKIDCNGPIEGLTATADSMGHVKGYVKNPLVDVPSAKPGKLNVGGALDLGVLSVIRDTGLKEPYCGQTILQTGEIGDDLTYYFATSEQTPSSVGLGVLMTKENTVQTAGGFIIQLLPSAREETIAALEERLGAFTSVTQVLEAGNTPEDMMKGLLFGMDPEFLESCPVEFKCDCSGEKTRDMIQSLPKKEIQEMIDDGKDIEVVCHFCSKVYKFTPEELAAMIAEK